MANFNSSANMSLPIPIVGVDTGPDYALNIDNCLTLIDSHDHSAGKGVQINPAGLNINTDLPLNVNNLTMVKTVRFSSQTSLAATSPNLACIFVIGADLYYNDANGNQVRITQSGSLAGAAGTITGLPSGTASAAYISVSQKFVFQSASNTAADMDVGSVIIREKVANAKGITLASPAALAADYALTLPGSLPVAQSFVTIDNSGNVASSISTIGGITSTMIGTKQVKNTNVDFSTFPTPTLTKLLSGSGTYTTPAGVTYLKIKMLGSGGGGGGAISGGAAGGGGAGGYIESLVASPAATYAYSIGIGGNGGLSNVDGTNGGDTTFGANTAGGGQGGKKGTTGTGGAGGAVTLSLGIGFAMIGNGGGIIANASVGGTAGGPGGVGFFGGGPIGNNSTNSTGAAGTANSGSGGAAGAAVTGSGGDGGSGVILIEEYYT